MSITYMIKISHFGVSFHAFIFLTILPLRKSKEIKSMLKKKNHFVSD